MAAAAFPRMLCVDSLQKDIAKKLGLDSAKEAEAVAGKAILDRVIDATIDHDKQFLQSKVRLFAPRLGLLVLARGALSCISLCHAGFHYCRSRPHTQFCVEA